MSGRWNFHRSKKTAATADLTWKNPARGFYHVYTYDLTAQECEEDWGWSLQRKERLALVLLDIGGCAGQDLSEEHLAKAARIFSLFADNHMQMIVRVVYDRLGHGREREPDTLEQVQRHMRRMAEVLLEYASDIFVFQGLFIGSWGEMHDSRYADEASLRKLYKTFCDATKGNIRLAVRKPQLQRMLTASAGTVVSGLYDDAILGSDTDMGTFGWLDNVSDPTVMWTPQRELQFIEQQSRRVSCGGEILAGALEQPWDQVLERMRRMQLTYLNRVHEPCVWQQWEIQPDPLSAVGRTKLETLQAYLGYRYELEDLFFTRTVYGAGFVFTIRNAGFACCYDRLRMELCVGAGRQQIYVDGTQLAAGASASLSVPLLSPCEPVEALPVVLTLYHEPSGLPIYFAEEVCARNQCSSSPDAGIEVGVLLMENDAAR